MSNRNPPYAEKTSGAPYGLPYYSYVLGNAGNKKGTASGDVYYIAVDEKGGLYGGAQVNNATDITWKKTATKDDLTKSIDFRGNAKTFKVRSGTDGLKNIYLDIEDGSGNTCSLAFLSDGENAVKLMLNGKTVWTK